MTSLQICDYTTLVLNFCVLTLSNIPFCQLVAVQ